MAQRKFLFLYLNTGGGHLASAKVLKDYVEQLHPEASVTLLNGFNQSNFVSKLLFEKGYHSMCTFMPGLWHMVYEIAKSRAMQTLVSKFVKPQTSHYLKEQIIENEITDIVSFHFALTPSALSAIRKSGRKVNLSVVVTDPFTVPNAWFYTKGVNTYVFSEQAKEEAVNKLGFDEKDIKIVPFLMNRKFLKEASPDDVKQLRVKYGIPTDKKVVLLAGGGEGLPGTLKIISDFIVKKVDFSIVVVCGRDKTTKSTLDMLKAVNPKLNLFTFGFVSFMDELVKLCDCAVIKAGPATLMEVLKSNKPVIISTYIHGQELGNVRFATENKVGWFIRKPKDISNKITQLFTDNEYFKSVKQRSQNLKIDTEMNVLVEDLFSK